MYIYVQAQDGTPLMPTTRCGKVRCLLRDGRAVIASHTPFTIRLTYDATHFTQPVSLGVGTLAHESMHIANFVGEWLGFLPKKSNEDEPQAYLVQWLSNCTDCVKRGHPEWMKGVKVD